MEIRGAQQRGVPVWFVLLGLGFVSALSTTIFLYTNFITRAEAQADKNDITERLTRIENKVDRLLEE